MIIPFVEKRQGLWTFLALLATVASIIIFNRDNLDIDTSSPLPQIKINKSKAVIITTGKKNTDLPPSTDRKPIVKPTKIPKKDFKQSSQLKNTHKNDCTGNIDIPIDCPL